MLYQDLSSPRRAVCILIGAAGVMALWWAAIWLDLVSALLLPSPVDVASALRALLVSKSFWLDVNATVTTWLLGVFLGTGLGTLLGFGVGLNRYVWAALEPWVEFLRSLPSVVLVPLVSIFLGVGAKSHLACSTLVVMLLMIASAASAIRATRVTYLRLAIAWRATAAQTLLNFYVPAAMSHLAVALRAAIPLALIVTVAADMLIATHAGLGRILMDSLAIFDTSKLYAGVVVVGFVGYGASLLSSYLERRTIHWAGA